MSSVSPLASLRLASLAAAAASMLIPGCDAPSGADVSAAGATPSTQAGAAEPGHPPPQDAPRFDVRVEFPERAPAGKEVLAKVHVEPRSPWHMNTDFPVALRIEAPAGVTVDLLKQRKDDAERFDDGGLVFALPFTPTSDGAKQIAGEVDFAVCGDAACAPETVPVAFTVEVGCDSGALC